MVYVDPAPPDALPIITDQLTTRLRELADNGGSVPFGATVELGYSFAHWILGADAVASITEPTWPDLVQLAMPLNRWHHQIKVNGKAIAFLHGELGTDSALCGLFLSSVAAAIDKSFAWIKETVKENLLVRLLEAPAYHVVAFWLIDESRKVSFVLVVSSLSKPKLERGRVLTSREFLEALHKHRKFGHIRPAKKARIVKPKVKKKGGGA